MEKLSRSLQAERNALKEELKKYEGSAASNEACGDQERAQVEHLCDEAAADGTQEQEKETASEDKHDENAATSETKAQVDLVN